MSRTVATNINPTPTNTTFMKLFLSALCASFMHRSPVLRERLRKRQMRQGEERRNHPRRLRQVQTRTATRTKDKCKKAPLLADCGKCKKKDGDATRKRKPKAPCSPASARRTATATRRRKPKALSSPIAASARRRTAMRQGEGRRHAARRQVQEGRRLRQGKGSRRHLSPIAASATRRTAMKIRKKKARFSPASARRTATATRKRKLKARLPDPSIELITNNIHQPPDHISGGCFV